MAIKMRNAPIQPDAPDCGDGGLDCAPLAFALPERIADNETGQRFQHGCAFFASAKVEPLRRAVLGSSSTASNARMMIEPALPAEIAALSLFANVVAWVESRTSPYFLPYRPRSNILRNVCSPKDVLATTNISGLQINQRSLIRAGGWIWLNAPSFLNDSP